MTIEEIMAQLKAILDAAEGRSLTDEEANRYEELEGELTAVRRTAEIRSRQTAYETPVRNDLHVNVAVKEEVDEQTRAFNTYLRTGDASVYAEYRAQTIGSDAAGGYAVPDTFQAKIIEKMVSFGGLANEAETITTATGEPLHWMTADDSGNVGEIVDEGDAAAGGADLVFDTDVLGSFKYEATGDSADPLKVSWELLQDANFDIEGYIARKFAERIARKMAVDFCTGAGTTEPQGIVTPATAADEIASNTDGPTYAELLGAEGAIDVAYQSGAKWLMHQTTWAKIRAQVDLSGRPLVMPMTDASIASGVSKALLGYPVVIDNGMPVLGDQSKSIVFGNLRESYIIRMVKGFQMVVLKELYAVNGFVGFLGWSRADGKVQNPNAYTVLGGQNTV